MLLELLDLLDVGDQLDTDLLEWWATIAEMILDHPLCEGLGDDGPPILDTELLSEGRFIGSGCLRSDPVDHGIREVALLVDPVRE